MNVVLKAIVIHPDSKRVLLRRFRRCSFVAAHTMQESSVILHRKGS